jgi:hypothetical protein
VHWWSEEEKEFLRQHYTNHSQRQLLDMFNERFNVAIGISQLTGALRRYDIKSGRTGQFNKNQRAWNKGMKGINLSGENGMKTQFKVGHKPHNYKPVGTERVNGDDYVDIKIADPNKWKAKHILVWEKEHGPVPKGHAVIFGDGNRRNFSLDNLILVTRKQLVRLNQNHLIKDNTELTKMGLIIADIHSKIGERKRGIK